MADKRRVHQVAKEFNISNEALIAYLGKLKYDVRGPMMALTDEMYEQVSKKYRKEPEAHEADHGFRKRLRDKKVEEEKERERVHHEIEQRMSVTTKKAPRFMHR